MFYKEFIENCFPLNFKIGFNTKCAFLQFDILTLIRNNGSKTTLETSKLLFGKHKTTVFFPLFNTKKKQRIYTQANPS